MLQTNSIQYFKFNIYFATFIFIVAITILEMPSLKPWIQAYFYNEGPTGIISFAISFYCFSLGICWENCGQCKSRPPYCKKYCMVIALIFTFILYPLVIIGLPILVGTQNGKIKYKADCFPSVYNLELYNSICNEEYENKYLIFKVKSCSNKKILLALALGFIPIVSIFYLIVLMMNYIQRAVPDFQMNRIYDAIVYLIDNNGDKICADDIEIECEPEKILKNVKGKNIKGKNIKYEGYIYKRKIKLSSSSFNKYASYIYLKSL